MENTFANIDRARLQALVPQVLQRLEQFAPLPKVGTVAGQAVASIFQELLGHPVRGPVNDIDVFVDWRVPRPLRGRADPPVPPTIGNWVQKTGRHTTGMALVVGGSMKGLPVITTRSNINIMRTYRDGLINYTLVEPTGVGSESWASSLAVSQNIVEGFDLNLVGVGINLQSHQVVATDEYIQFLRTSQLKVKTCNTPIHTLIRLANKITSGQITGVKCNFNHERALLEAAIYCQRQYMDQLEDYARKGCHFVGTFGSGKYLDMFKSCSALLPPLGKVDVAGTTRSGEPSTSVTLNTLVVPPPSHPAIKKMVEKLISQRFPEVLRTPAMCADFPRLFNLFSQATPSPQQSQRMEMFLGLLDENTDDADQNNVHKYNCVVFGRDFDSSLAIQNDVLDSFDSALFFFNQVYAATPELQKQALDAYESLRRPDSLAIMKLGLGADAAVSLATDPKSALKFMLQHDPIALLDCYTAPRYDDVEYSRARIMELIELGQSLDPKVRKHLAGQILEIKPNGEDVPNNAVPNNALDTLPPAWSAFVMLPPREGRKFALTLLDWMCPKFPDMSDLDQSERIGLLASRMAFLGESMPRHCGVNKEHFHVLLGHVLDMARLFNSSFQSLEAFSDARVDPGFEFFGCPARQNSDLSQLLATAPIQRLVNELLPSVTWDHLLDNGGRLLGMLASTLSPDDFISYLSSSPSISLQNIKQATQIAQTHAQRMTGDFSTANEFDVPSTQGLFVWAKDAEYLLASLKKAGLIRHSGVEPSSQPPVSTRMKM